MYRVLVGGWGGVLCFLSLVFPLTGVFVSVAGSMLPTVLHHLSRLWPRFGRTEGCSDIPVSRASPTVANVRGRGFEHRERAPRVPIRLGRDESDRIVIDTQRHRAEAPLLIGQRAPDESCHVVSRELLQHEDATA